MKYCRFRFEGQIEYGVVEDRGGEPWIVDLTHAPEEDTVAHLSKARAVVKGSCRFRFRADAPE